ncbi:hypothetical protein NFJ02_34g85220 [Pycnococcus provasolii]
MQLSRSSSGVRVTDGSLNASWTRSPTSPAHSHAYASEPPQRRLLCSLTFKLAISRPWACCSTWSISRPDLAYATRAAAQGMARPTAADWQQVERILGYLRQLSITGCLSCYAWHPTCVPMWTLTLPERSTEMISGMLGAFGQQGAFMWKSTKQHLTAKSSTEAELLLSPTTVHPSSSQGVRLENWASSSLDRRRTRSGTTFGVGVALHRH